MSVERFTKETRQTPKVVGPKTIKEASPLLCPRNSGFGRAKTKSVSPSSMREERICNHP